MRASKALLAFSFSHRYYSKKLDTPDFRFGWRILQILESGAFLGCSKTFKQF